MPRGIDASVWRTNVGLVLLVVVLGFLTARSHRTTPWTGTQVEYEEHVEVILFVSASCGASHLLAPSFMADARAKVTSKAAAAGLRTYFSGVSVDTSPEEGISFLSGLGPFDQLSAGLGWINAGAIQFLHRGLPGPPSIPQVVVIRRRAGLEGDVVTVGADQLLARKVGLDELLTWQANGFPIALSGGGRDASHSEP